MENRKTLVKMAAATAFTDPRDGFVYRTAKIGEQIWLAQNLAFAIPGSECFDSLGVEIYGRLYNWEMAKKACPPGWHLPSKAEWDILSIAVGCAEAGENLKAAFNWKRFLPKPASDSFGFSAIPGGYGYADGRLDSVDVDGYWWSSSEWDSDRSRAYCRVIYWDKDEAEWNESAKELMFCVRCVRD
jgi:uncharacterized protein (TIGR02145 family)